MEKLKKRKKTINLKINKKKVQKQKFFNQVLTKCQQFFSPSDLDFFIKYIMIKKSYHSTYRILNSQIINPNKYTLQQEGQFQLRPVNPMLFLLNRQKKFVQNQNPKIQIEKQNNRRLVTTPNIKKQKTLQIQNFNLFSLDKKMREKKKCLKTQFRQVQCFTTNKNKRTIIPQYSYAKTNQDRKFNRSLENRFNYRKLSTKQLSLSKLKGSWIPIQYLKNLNFTKKLRNSKPF